MRRALVGGMHTVLFEMKQGHLTAERFTRPQTESLGLTPARLDMLRAILERGNGITQSQLRRSLCVTKTVISVMVRALERLGFVRRVKCATDRRTFYVTLTDTARLALRWIYYENSVMGFLNLAFISAFVKMPRIVRGEVNITLSRLNGRIQMFRHAFGIGTYNPWEANDDDESFYYADVPENPNAVDLIPRPEEVDHGSDAWCKSRYRCG